MDIYELFDTAFPEDAERRRKCDQEEDNLCNHQWRDVDGMKTCIECGVTNLVNFTSEKYCIPTYKSYHVYYRSHYFKEKLLLLGGYKQCTKDGYNDMINDLKKLTIKNINHLRRYMKFNEYSKYYKYIYSIYYEITGKRAIHLTREQIDTLSTKFVQFEKIYKKMFSKNPNYSVVIICLLKRYGYNTSNLLCSKTATAERNRISTIINLL